ncbi:hypothetical protein ACDW82_13035 [Alcaligenes faecalis]|uniref:hypothetical protein n=1 Tax=Alcaligenes faecalis TaxID=511 RepID=UPI003558BFB3
MTILPSEGLEQEADAGLGAQVQTLLHENQQLFDQLEVVQQALELQHDKDQYQTIDRSTSALQPIVVQMAPVDHRVLEVQAENIRFQALVAAQSQIHELQRQFALAGQLGSMLIEGSRSARAAVSVPGRLYRTWRQNRREIPPASLGGKGFETLIQAYQSGGEEAVSALLKKASVSSAIEASAWTAVARTQLYLEPGLVAVLARRAYALDPRSFRLKWLAFRLHEAGELLEAEALLSLLPPDISFSSSESRQVDRLKSEAHAYRLEQARAVLAYGEQQADQLRRWQELAQSRNDLASQSEQQRGYIASLEQEVSLLKRDVQRQSTTIAKFHNEHDVLGISIAQLKKVRDEYATSLEQEQSRVLVLRQDINVLKQRCEQSNAVVVEWQAKSERLQVELEQLMQANQQLQTELALLQKTSGIQNEQWLTQSTALQTALVDIDVRRAELEQLTHANQNLPTELTLLQKSSDIQNEQWLAQSTALQTALVDIDMQRAELEQLTQANQNLQAELALLQKSSDIQNEQWLAQSTALQATLVDTELQRAEVEQLATQRLEDCNVLRAKLQRLEQTYAELVLSAAHQSDQLQELHGQLNDATLAHERVDLLANQRLEDYRLLRDQFDDLSQMHDELATLAQQRLEQCESLKTELGLVRQSSEEQQACVAQLSEQCEFWQAEFKSMSRSHDEQEELALNRLQQCESLRLELGALAHTHDQQVQLVAQRLAQVEQLQVELRDMSRLRDEQAELAAQRQGQLMELTRGYASLEKTKLDLESRQKDLEVQLAEQIKRDQDMTQQLMTQVQALVTQQPVLRTVVEDTFKKTADELNRVRRHLESVIKGNAANSVRQVQSYIGLQEYLGAGTLPAFNSQGQSWPVSSDFALFLLQRLELEPYDLVIEFGSGMSTVLVARALAAMAERSEAVPTLFISFDHLDFYCDQTRQYLRQANVEKSVELVFAPLINWKAPDGTSQPYYDCSKALAKLVRVHGVSIRRVLVIVDGPPTAVGPLARYPAGPLVQKYFSKARIDFLMDDYVREEEKKVAQRWLTEMKAAGLTAEITEYKFEKDACLITVLPKDEKAK